MKQEQISDYVGSIVNVTLVEGGVVYGSLSFFDWNKKVIHLNNCTMQRENEILKMQFMVINSESWKDIQIREE